MVLVTGQKKYKLTVTGLFQGVQMVYVPLMPGHNSRLPKKYSFLRTQPLRDVILTACPDRLRRLITREKGQKYVDLIVTFENDDGSDVNGPPVRFWLTSKRKKAAKPKPPASE